MNNVGRIVKARRSNDFTQVPNDILQDPELTWKAKGLLCYLLSLHDDWVVHVSELHSHSKEGLAATRTAFKELQEAGYILSRRVKQDSGNLYAGWEHVVFDKPQPGNTQNKEIFVNAPAASAKPVDAPVVDAKTTPYINTNSTNTEESIIWPTFNDFWTKYDKVKDEKKCREVWKKIPQAVRELIMEHLGKYIPATPDKTYRKNPYNYLKNDGYRDEIITATEAKRIVGNGLGSARTTEQESINRLNNYSD